MLKEGPDPFWLGFPVTPKAGGIRIPDVIVSLSENGLSERRTRTTLFASKFGGATYHVPPAAFAGALARLFLIVSFL